MAADTPLLARVYVTPKREILDPQGKAIQHSLHSLGYAEVGDVRLGKYLEIRLAGADLDVAQARVDEMCRRLLANGVIEDYRFEVGSPGETEGSR
jgi:phosphoribosylformylglycinamidine synthase PurS subunit